MQFREVGRLRVIRRMEGRGKEINIVSETFGGGVWKFGCGILRDDWKRRMGMGVRQRM
jgi:hypothetical protein